MEDKKAEKKSYLEGKKRKSKRVLSLQRLFEKHAQIEVKVWFDAHLKGAIHYRGLKTPLVRRLVSKWLKEETQKTDRLRLESLKQAAFELLMQPYAEDKFAGILIFEEEILPRHALDEEDLENFAELFQKAFLSDWNTVDCFSVRVLSKIIEAYAGERSDEMQELLLHWASQDNLWQARAAAVSLVRLARRGDENFVGFFGMSLEICRKLVARPERFAQTGAGWLLRELSVANRPKALRFIEKYASHMSSEGLRYACEKLPPELRSQMIELRKKPSLSKRTKK